MSPQGPLPRLTIVAPSDELRGHAPMEFERLARTAQPGSPDHVGLTAISLALSERAARACLPPSARALLEPAFQLVSTWLRATSAGKPATSVLALREMRAGAFASLPLLESHTTGAIDRARSHPPHGPTTLLDEHADHVVRRYVRLSAHHTVAAVCHLLDGLGEPLAALEVPSDAGGARAYQLSALSSARNPTFRQAAVDQATWESARAGGDGGHSAGALAIQIFHEYLGARWRAFADQERAASAEFISWALGARPTVQLPVRREGPEDTQGRSYF